VASLNAKKQDKEHTKPVDLPIEVTITEPRPKGGGGYSDVYIGRFSDKIVRLLDALLGNARLMLAFRWL
jgi:hypothetical protein